MVLAVCIQGFFQLPGRQMQVATRQMQADSMASIDLLITR